MFRPCAYNIFWVIGIQGTALSTGHTQDTFAIWSLRAHLDIQLGLNGIDQEIDEIGTVSILQSARIYCFAPKTQKSSSFIFWQSKYDECIAAPAR